MAEQAALRKRSTTVKRLKATCKLLTEVLDGAEDVPPTLERLTKHIMSNEQAWEKFDAAHFAFLELVEEEDNEAEEAEYQDLMRTVNDLIGKAEHLKAVRRGDAVNDVPEAASLEQRIDLAKTDLEGVFEDINAVLKSVATHLRKTDVCQDSLAVCSRQLDHAEELLEGNGATNALKELVRLDPAEAVGHSAAKALKVGEMRMILETLRGSVAITLGKVEPRVIPRATMMGTAFKKRDPPKFDGQRRNYPSFKKEWLVSVTGKLDPTTEVREIRYSTPSYDEPDLKNLHTMKEIWEFLDEKYGKVMELSRELIMGLQKFSYSRGARSDSAKFKELNREWTKVHNDLEQVGELRALDHKPTLLNIASMLPCSDSKMRYTQMRARLLDENKEWRRSQAAAQEELTAEPTELHIMNTFMKAEKRLQENFEHLCGSQAESPVRRDERASGGKCDYCGKPGHKTEDCYWKEGGGGIRATGGRSANANMKLMPKACPACKDQHPFYQDNREGEAEYLRYKTRLSCCDTFRIMSPADRAIVIEQAEGCALCTDWTGSHTRDKCEENVSKDQRFSTCEVEVGGVKCGRRHHRLLHGANSRFCNYFAMNTVGKNRMMQRAPPTVEETEKADTVTATLQVQKIPTTGKADDCNTLLDSGSNVALVEAEFAKKSGWKATEVNLEMQAAEKRAEIFKTRTHCVELINRTGKIEEVMAYEMPRCTSLLGKVDEGNFQLPRIDQEELNLIKRNMVLDAEAKQVRMKYPYIKDSALLVDNRDQVTAMAKKLEERLAKAGQLEAFNAEIEGYVHRGAFKELSEVEMRNGERLIPINVNQLLLGRTSTVRTEAEDPELGDFRACSAYGDKIINQCWNRWKQVGFVSLLPYPEIKHAKRHQNLQVGDVCLVYYDNKVKGTYRLCIVVEAVNSRDDIVRTVKVGFRPRRHCGAGGYVSTPLFELEVAVQRLVLLVRNDESKFA